MLRTSNHIHGSAHVIVAVIDVSCFDEVFISKYRYRHKLITVLIGTTILHSSNRFFTNVQNHIFFVNTYKCTSRCIIVSVIKNLNKY